jgi:hypothetical protein
MIALCMCLLGWAGRARAQFPSVTDRDYALDIYQGPVLNSARTLGMGGASIGAGEWAAGMSANAAAPAVRHTTSNDKWDWDWNLDAMNPDVRSSDFDNNGVASPTVQSAQVATGALVGNYRQWALGYSYSFQRYSVTVPDGTRTAQFQVGKLALARSLLDSRLTVGLGANSGDVDIAGAKISGGSLAAGALLRPAGRSLRVGISGGLPIIGGKVDAAACDPLNCAGYILPGQIRVPWEVGIGFAWRWAPTPWNQQVFSRWRDERAVIVAADLLVTGPVTNGFGVEAFLEKMLQPSGRTAAVSLRMGAEYEWLPGRLRVRAGTYWEPARFEGVVGRQHITLGAEARFWQFTVFGWSYRMRASLTADGARQYGNVGASLGFWH